MWMWYISKLRPLVFDHERVLESLKDTLLLFLFYLAENDEQKMLLKEHIYSFINQTVSGVKANIFALSGVNKQLP